MKRKWFPVLFLPLLLAAEDFEAYPDTAALRRVWQAVSYTHLTLPTILLV